MLLYASTTFSCDSFITKFFISQTNKQKTIVYSPVDFYAKIQMVSFNSHFEAKELNLTRASTGIYVVILYL